MSHYVTVHIFDKY